MVIFILVVRFTVAGVGVFESDVSVSGDLDVATNASIGGTFTATGATQLGSTVTVVGKAVFEGDVSVSGDIDVATNASIGGTLVATGASQFGSTVTVAGAAIFKDSVFSIR